MLKTVLLILTLTEDGATRVTLTESDSPADCEASRDVVTQILTGAGNAPLAALCGETGLRLTPFVHGTPPEAETNLYRVELPKSGGFTIAPLAEGEACAPDTAADPAVWCARSGQSVLPNG
ncbi:hypothetical protein [Tabrizicola sp.]|uniref:hypothetical protein n=1 Tax=Tabrizicola sp. TaxID=2005166 RepID=UPI002FDF033E